MADKKLAIASYSFWDYDNSFYSGNIYSPSDVDKFDEKYLKKEYREMVDKCRFYYRKDPIAGTVLNKMIDIGITKLFMEKGNLSDNEIRIYESVLPMVQEFARDCALEYLVSGFVIPEVIYDTVSKDTLNKYGIKRYTSLTLPVTTWLRDPKTIRVASEFEILGQPKFFIEIPDEIIQFILNKGVYENGEEDKELYQMLVEKYPEFVEAINEGKTEVPLENDLIIRRKVLTDTPYPTPYLSNVIESLKFKRNLRRMDYSIASRVISAIMLIKLGSDEYPVTEDEEDAFEHIKQQMAWRNTQGRDTERIFQLFANHTLEIEWIFPDVDALLNEKKYADINEDIFFGLGFPRILTTGETLRTGSSNAEYATMSPVRTMESIRDEIILIVEDIFYQIKENNRGIINTPVVYFSPINLYALRDFIDGMTSLYDTGNISRTSYTKAFGFNWEEEMSVKSEEKDMMEELGLEEFAPQPFSPQPNKDKTVPKSNQQVNKPTETE